MKLDEIKAELKGYFIHRQDRIRELAVKENDNFRLITDGIKYPTVTGDKIEISPMKYLLMQINQQLLDPTAYVNDLTEVLEMIDFNVFEAYDKRELEIQKHKAILEKIQNSKSIFGRKKDFKLIYTESKSIIAKGERKYYVIKDADAVPIESALLDDVTNAVEVEDITDVKNALADDFENGYFEKYKEECRKWESLN